MIMLLDSENFEAWMERIMDKLECLERKMKKEEKVRHRIDGELLLDNQDLCFMLNCSNRTLQRYRVSGKLPYKRIKQKTYYLESDVHNFIRKYLK